MAKTNVTTTIAPPRRKYPRATVKKILKGHTSKSLSRNVDALVYLDYILFLERLFENATRKAKESADGRGAIKGVAAKDIRKVTGTTLKQFRG